MPSARLFEPNEQNLRDRTLDSPFFFRYKHITSPKNHHSLTQGESLPYWFRGNCCGRVNLIDWLREFPLSAVANNFEWRCQLEQLLLLYFKICPCSVQLDHPSTAAVC